MSVVSINGNSADFSVKTPFTSRSVSGTTPPIVLSNGVSQTIIPMVSNLSLGIYSINFSFSYTGNTSSVTNFTVIVKNQDGVIQSRNTVLTNTTLQSGTLYYSGVVGVLVMEGFEIDVVADFTVAPITITNTTPPTAVYTRIG